MLATHLLKATDRMLSDHHRDALSAQSEPHWSQVLRPCSGAATRTTITVEESVGAWLQSLTPD